MVDIAQLKEDDAVPIKGVAPAETPSAIVHSESQACSDMTPGGEAR